MLGTLGLMKDDIEYAMKDDGTVFIIPLRKDILVLGPDIPWGCLLVDCESEVDLRCDVGRKAPAGCRRNAGVEKPGCM